MNTELAQYIEFHRKLTALATRWVKGFGKYAGYNSVGSVHLSFDNTEICFQARCTDSWTGWELSMPIKYIDDDSTLEIDAETWYEEDKQRKLMEAKKLRDLESSTEVQEYLKLKNPHFNYFQTIRL